MNKVYLMGHLGAMPEKKETKGKSVTTFSLATTEKWMDKEGRKQEKTEWHRIACFDQLANIAFEYLKKGTQVVIEGKINYSQYEKDGQTLYSTTIQALRLHFTTGTGKKDGQKEAPVESRGDHVTTPGDVPGFTSDDIPF